MPYMETNSFPLMTLVCLVALPSLAAVCFLVLWMRQRAQNKTLAAAFSAQETLLAGLREAYRDLDGTKPLRELGQSTAFINHEIKNYMMVVSGYAALLQRSKTLDDKTRAMVDNIAQTVAKLQEFSTNVLEQSKSKIAHEDVEIDLVQMLKSCIEANFRENSSKFTVDCAAPDNTLLVNGSPGKLERVLACAFQNSLEAGAKAVRVRLSVHNYMALITIDDDGGGCGAADLPNLSTTFFTTKRSGTGLGLCVMRSIVEAHGGNISIYPKNLLGGGEHGLSVQIVIPASRKTPYTVVKSEMILVKEGLNDTPGILGTLKNLKIVPRVVETAKDVELSPKSSSLGITALAAAEQAATLKGRPAGTGEGIKILSIEKTAGGVTLVKDANSGGVGLFTEEYIIHNLCG
jgi:signal transduction histidine kinase